MYFLKAREIVKKNRKEKHPLSQSQRIAKEEDRKNLPNHLQVPGSLSGGTFSFGNICLLSTLLKNGRPQQSQPCSFPKHSVSPIAGNPKTPVVVVESLLVSCFENGKDMILPELPSCSMRSLVALEDHISLYIMKAKL